MSGGGQCWLGWSVGTRGSCPAYSELRLGLAGVVRKLLRQLKATRGSPGYLALPEKYLKGGRIGQGQLGL